MIVTSTSTPQNRSDNLYLSGRKTWKLVCPSQMSNTTKTRGANLDVRVEGKRAEWRQRGRERAPRQMVRVVKQVTRRDATKNEVVTPT